MDSHGEGRLMTSCTWWQKEMFAMALGTFFKPPRDGFSRRLEMKKRMETRDTEMGRMEWALRGSRTWSLNLSRRGFHFWNTVDGDPGITAYCDAFKSCLGIFKRDEEFYTHLSLLISHTPTRLCSGIDLIYVIDKDDVIV